MAGWSLAVRMVLFAIVLIHFVSHTDGDRTASVKPQVVSRVNRSLPSRERLDNEQYTFPDDVCIRDADTADCSQHCGTLLYVPRLPESVRSLNFSYNCLERIPTDNFFDNVTFITSLDLGNNALYYISPKAFLSLSHLQYLSLVYNNLSYPALHPVFSVPTLVTLDLRFNGLPKPPSDIFSKYPMPDLQILYLHSNNIAYYLDLSVFVPLKSLRKLGVANNQFSQVMTPFRPLRNLTKLNLKTNAIFRFPDTCREGSSLFPRLTHLFLRDNHIMVLPGTTCLPSLQLLDLSENTFKVFPAHAFNSHRFPTLDSLYLESMSVHFNRIEEFAFRNPSLRKISLMFNNLAFDSRDIDADSFTGCPNLVTLQISHNYISNITEGRFLRLFGNLTKLRYLYMGNAYIYRITRGMFSPLQSLTKLSLYQNRLADVPDGIVDGLLNLDTLDLNRNQISVIRETTFSPATRRRLRRLDLSGKPFLCSCKLRWFRNWLAAESSKFTHSWTSYTCHDRDDLNVTAFVIVPQACLLSQEANIIIIVVITILIVVSTLLSALYHYRWHIRLLLYEAFRGRGDRWRRLEENHFQFDVFVSSASEDLQWVRQHLMPELEERLGLRLCVHERDFIPGKNIVANIEDCVEASKKVLMVFSTNFSRSQWCQFELRLCHHHVTEHDDDLLVVFLEDIVLPSRDMTSYMMAVMRTTTYIEWADSPEARTAFWGRIQLALHDVMKSSSPSHLIQDRA